MNNLYSFMGWCPQFWMLPNGMIAGGSYMPQMTVYPQMVMPGFNSMGSMIVPDAAPKLQPVTQQSEIKAGCKQTNQNTMLKIDTEKSTVILDSTEPKQQNIKSEMKKAQRPQKYLTEKAFFMNQKLKGKLKTGERLLRKRLKNKQRNSMKGNEDHALSKKQLEAAKALKKRMPIAKDSEKQKKIINQIKIKLLKQYRQDLALIPKRILGQIELNEFSMRKLQSLMARQVSHQDSF